MQEITLIRRPADQQNRLSFHTNQEQAWLTFPNLDACDLVSHCISTRFGGVSEGIFANWNFNYSRGDDPASVDENYRRLAQLFHTTADAFVCTDQTHTTNIRLVTGADAGKGVVCDRDYTDIDGLITDTPGLILSTFYADCVPLVFADPVHRAIGCAHSGWRGTVAGMASHMVQAMKEAFGSCPEDLLVGIGPSICQDCYEVSTEVAEQFARRFSPAVLKPGRDADHFQLDLWQANRELLLGAGVAEEHLCVTDICTCENPSVLFSHRASAGKRGNFGAFIMLRGESND